MHQFLPISLLSLNINGIVVDNGWKLRLSMPDVHILVVYLHLLYFHLAIRVCLANDEKLFHLASERLKVRIIVCVSELQPG